MPSDAQIQRALRKHGTKRAAARSLGMPESTFRSRLKKALDEAKLPGNGMQVKQSTVSYDRNGEVVRQSVTTKAAPGEPYEVPPDFSPKAETVLTDGEGRLVLKWTKARRNAEALQSLVDDLRQAFAQHEGRAPLVPAPQVVSSELLTIYPIPDLHMGLYAWGQECGDDYDTEIATRTALKAVSKLVGRASPSEHAVLLVNGDYYHQNDQKNATPRSGHRLDVDGRWDRVYFNGAELLLAMVDLLLQKHKQVELVVLSGNHDEDAAVTLRVAMKLYYRNHERVRVYDRPGLFWYRLFGTTLLGALHGHTMRNPKDMALTMAADCAEAWGKAQFRQIFTGHIHHERAQEAGPVRWESFQAPGPTDAHARASGYRSGRSLISITIHKEDGEIGRHRENILPRFSVSMGSR